MCVTHKAALLRAAYEYLGCQGYEGKRFTVTVSGTGMTMTFECRGEPPSAEIVVQIGSRLLSPVEAKIVTGLRGGAWVVHRFFYFSATVVVSEARRSRVT